MFFSSVRMTHIGEADGQNYKLDYPKADLQILCYNLSDSSTAETLMLKDVKHNHFTSQSFQYQNLSHQNLNFFNE